MTCTCAACKAPLPEPAQLTADEHAARNAAYEASRRAWREIWPIVEVGELVLMPERSTAVLPPELQAAEERARRKNEPPPLLPGFEPL